MTGIHSGSTSDRLLRLESFFAGALVSAVLFVATPNRVILATLSELPYDVPLLLFFLGAFTLTALVGGAAVIRAPGSRTYRVALRLGWGLALAILAWTLTYAAARSVGEFRSLLALDAAAAILAIGGACALPFALLRRFAAFLSVGILVHSVATHVRGVERYLRTRDVGGPLAGTPYIAIPPPSTPRDVGNVYHIMFDALQSDAFEILRARDGTYHPGGFTYYPQFLSNYFLTEHAMAAVLTGRYLRKMEQRAAWVRESIVGGLWQNLATHGIQVTQYVFNAERDCSPYAAGGCYSPLELAKEEEGDAYLSRAQRAIVDYWVSSLAPTTLRFWKRDEFLADGRLKPAMLGHAAPAFSITGVLLPADTQHPPFPYTMGYWSLQNFDRMLEDEAGRPGRGQYVYIHCVLPHSPYVLAPDCSVRPESTHFDAYLDQSACALWMIERLRDRLVALGRWDDALIVIHSDHGMYPTLIPEFVLQYPERCPAEVAQAVESRVRRLGQDGAAQFYDRHFAEPEVIETRSAATLLMKFPGQVSAQDSGAPARLIDIAPTILEHYGLPNRGGAGHSLVGAPAATLSEARFFLGPKHEADRWHWWTTNAPMTFTEFIRQGDVWRPAGPYPTQ